MLKYMGESINSFATIKIEKMVMMLSVRCSQIESRRSQSLFWNILIYPWCCILYQPVLCQFNNFYYDSNII